MGSILIFGSFCISVVTVQKILESKNRYDLAILLEVLFKLAMIGLFGYILIDLLQSLFSIFGL